MFHGSFSFMEAPSTSQEPEGLIGIDAWWRIAFP
jgi:hypothetical protein